jgi:hypothetical protein
MNEQYRTSRQLRGGAADMVQHEYMPYDMYDIQRLYLLTSFPTVLRTL